MKVIPTKIFKKQIAQLEKSNPNVIPSIFRKVESITKWLVPREAVKGYQGILKTRIWKYRLAYKINNWKILILILIRKREQSYKDLANLLDNQEF